MTSTFFEIETMRRAILSQRSVMATIGHNIANATTPGYTRQQAVLGSTGAYPTVGNNGGLYGAGQIGTGVIVEQVRRIRDEFVDKQLRIGTTDRGQLNVEKATLTQIENIFNEPSTTEGMNDALTKFFNQWQELSKRPDNTAVRQQVLSTAQNLTDAIHGIDQTLREVRVDLNGQLRKDIIEVNRITHEIGNLNQGIAHIVGNGDTPNDLMDKRDLLLDELSNYIDFTVSETEASQIAVNVGGRELIRNSFVYDVTDEFAWDHPSQNSQTPYFSDVSQQDFFMLMNNSKGELKGLMNSRDIIVPEFQKRFTDFVNTIINEVNTAHSAGLGANLPNMGSIYSTTTAITGGSDNVAISPGTLKGLSVGEKLRIEDPATKASLTVAISRLDTVNSKIYFEPVGELQKSIQTGAGTYNSQAITIPAGAQIRVIEDPKNNFFQAVTTLPYNFVGDSRPEFSAQRTSVINIPDNINMNSTIKDLENAFGVDITDNLGKVLRLDNAAVTPLLTETMTLQTVFNRISSMSTIANGEKPLEIKLDEVNHRIILKGDTIGSLDELGGTTGSENNLFRILGFEGQNISGMQLPPGTNLSTTLADLGISSGWLQIDNANIVVDSGETLKQALDRINTALNSSGSSSVGTNIFFDPTGARLRIVSDHQFSTNTTPLPVTAPYASNAASPVTTSNFLRIAGLQREDGVATDSNVQALASITSSDAGARIAVNEKLLKDPNMLAAAMSLAGVPGDNAVALAVSAIKNTYFMNDTTSGFTEHPTETIDESYNNMIAKLGTEAQRAIVDGEVNQRFVEFYQAKRQEVSGVSLDEELTKMIESQHAFAAASRVITTVDGMLDRIINGMGTVGR